MAKNKMEDKYDGSYKGQRTQQRGYKITKQHKTIHNNAVNGCFYATHFPWCSDIHFVHEDMIGHLSPDT